VERVRTRGEQRKKEEEKTNEQKHADRDQRKSGNKKKIEVVYSFG